MVFSDLFIKDNFLSEDQFNQLKTGMENLYFPWFYNDGKVYDGDGYDQFCHQFYNMSTGHHSKHTYLVEPLLKKMGANNVYKVKCNMNFRKFFRRRTSYHIDMENVTTAIFYLDTNNGGTKFKGGPFVRSRANRIVFFKSNFSRSDKIINATKPWPFGGHSWIRNPL